MLITGGGSGIGAAAARRMARAGYAVCVSGRRREPLEQVAAEIGGTAAVADTGDPASAEHAVNVAVEKLRRLDALVLLRRHRRAGGGGRPDARSAGSA